MRRNKKMYMLLQVDKEENGVVEGTHMQWCCACSLEEATTRARGVYEDIETVERKK